MSTLGEERRAAHTLGELHYEPLCVYADVKATWDRIVYLTLETVPRACGDLAIRRAIGRLAMDFAK